MFMNAQALLLSFLCMNKHHLLSMSCVSKQCCCPSYAWASIAAVLVMHKQAMLPSLSPHEQALLLSFSCMSKHCCCRVCDEACLLFQKQDSSNACSCKTSPAAMLALSMLLYVRSSSHLFL